MMTSSVPLSVTKGLLSFSFSLGRLYDKNSVIIVQGLLSEKGVKLDDSNGLFISDVNLSFFLRNDILSGSLFKILSLFIPATIFFFTTFINVGCKYLVCPVRNATHQIH